MEHTDPQHKLDVFKMFSTYTVCFWHIFRSMVKYIFKIYAFDTHLKVYVQICSQDICFWHAFQNICSNMQSRLFIFFSYIYANIMVKYIFKIYVFDIHLKVNVQISSQDILYVSGIYSKIYAQTCSLNTCFHLFQNRCSNMQSRYTFITNMPI